VEIGGVDVAAREDAVALFHSACRSKSLETVQWLWGFVSTRDDADPYTAFRIACGSQNRRAPHIVKWLATLEWERNPKDDAEFQQRFIDLCTWPPWWRPSEMLQTLQCLVTDKRLAVDIHAKDDAAFRRVCLHFPCSCRMVPCTYREIAFWLMDTDPTWERWPAESLAKLKPGISEVRRTWMACAGSGSGSSELQEVEK
jgi:hypothetical protein